MQINELLVLIESQEWMGVPNKIISREGVEMNTSTDIWMPPIVHGANWLKFNNIVLLNFKWALKKYVQHRIETVSSSAGLIAYDLVWRQIFRNHSINLTGNDADIVDAEKNLILRFEDQIAITRSKHRLHYMYGPIQWYIWVAETYPELGFSVEYASVLESMVIPGGPKGEAVRTEDPDLGPLHRTLELPLLIKALNSDCSMEFEHIQQRAALALSLAFGRNAANLTYLNIDDFKDQTPS